MCDQVVIVGSEACRIWLGLGSSDGVISRLQLAMTGAPVVFFATKIDADFLFPVTALLLW